MMCYDYLAMFKDNTAFMDAISVSRESPFQPNRN